MSIRAAGQNTIVQLNPFELKFFEYPVNTVNSSKTIVELIYYRFRLFLTNMAGYEIKVFMSEIPLFSVLVRNSSGNVIDYSGVDGTLLKLFTKFMNFTPIFVDIVTDPKIVSGLGSDEVIENGLAELGINSKFIPDVSYNNTVFLYPTDKLAMGFIVPINYEEMPLEILTYESFDVASRVIIALGLFFLSAIWMLGRRLIKKNIETASAAIPFKVIAILHNIPVPNPKSGFNQIVFITVTFFSLLLTSIYQGTIVQQLNNPLKPHQISTLKELYNSNLNITTLMYVQRPKEKTIQGTRSKDNIILTEEIGTKTVTQYESIQEGLDMVAYNKTTALLMPINFYAPFSGKYFNNTTGLDLLHVVTEPSSSMLISYVIARNSPYIHILNHVVKLSVENGILKHETVVARHEQHLYYIRRIKNGYVPKEKNHFRSIKLADLNYLQIFLFTNWTMGGIVFLLEHLVYLVLKFKRRKVNSRKGRRVNSRIN